MVSTFFSYLHGTVAPEIQGRDLMLPLMSMLEGLELHALPLLPCPSSPARAHCFFVVDAVR